MALLELDKGCAAPWGFPLLKDISLAMDSGEVLGIVGPNGAGKSSLLQVLSGQMSLSSGQLNFCGRPMTAWQRLERARSVALLPQSSQLNFPYTVEEVVLLGRTPHASGRQRDSAIADQVLNATDTANLRFRRYTRLSGGERQRVQLARILAQLWRAEDASARLLLLDEPNTALDPAHQQMVLELVRKLAADGAMVAMVMHDFNLVATAADQVMVLDDGHLASQGTPAQIFTHSMFKQTFKVAVHISQHPDTGRPMVFPA